MVDNQHKQIKGYRDLSQTEIDLMNECKEMAVQVNVLCDKLQIRKDADIDGRWLAIGRTDLQKGFMALVRSIARPETF
jgi:hypothetical protein